VEPKAAQSDNSVVAMKNEILPSLAKLKFSESRLFQYCLAHYDSRGNENPTFGASVEDLKRFFNIDYGNAYCVIRDAVVSLGSRPLQWREKNLRRVEHWFTGATYFEGEGMFEFRLNKAAEPYFLMLQEFFTRHRLDTAKSFKKAASFKLYINLKQWEKTGRWEVELDELRYRLGVTGKYPRWQTFKRCILAPTADEINTHSDLTVTWRPIKRSRRIIGVVFRIKSRAAKSISKARQAHEDHQLLEAL